MIETRLLQYFLAIAEEQSITRAAEYLHVTRPTLSKQSNVPSAVFYLGWGTALTGYC